MVKPKPDLLQGTLDMLVLKPLALGPRHGGAFRGLAFPGAGALGQRSA